MSEENLDRDDARLASALRSGLAARDRSARPPRFAAVWQSASEPGSFRFAWRPAIATLAAVVVVVALSWMGINREASVDEALARQLSSPAYWRVPTDELLAFAAPPLSADLPSPTGFQVSLEESLL